MFLVVFLAIVIGVLLCYLWVKLVNAIFNPMIRFMDRKQKRLNKEDNPYIQAHRMKFYNDELYEEYLEWLDKQGGDIPFEKWKTDEERSFENKLEL